MYVKRIFFDDWRNPDNTEKCILFPTWEETENIINMLDGKNVTQITMDNGNEDNYLCIGGGNNGLYNVYVSENDNLDIYTLINARFSPMTMHKLVTGGQSGDFEDKICVPVEIVMKAVKKYFEDGQKDNTYLWE